MLSLHNRSLLGQLVLFDLFDLFDIVDFLKLTMADFKPTTTKTINGLPDAGYTKVVKIPEILSGLRHLETLNRQNELVYIDYDSFNDSNNKSYSGAKFIRDVRLFLGIVSSAGNMHYGYYRFDAIMLDPVQLQLGTLSSDNPKRQGNGHGCAISADALSIAGARTKSVPVGDALKAISDSVSHTYNLPETLKKLAKLSNKKLTVPYDDKNVDKGNAPIIRLAVSVKHEKVGNNMVVKPDDLVTTAFIYPNKKPVLHEGKPLTYATLHNYLTMGSIVSGYLSAVVSASNMGFSFKLQFSSAVLKVGAGMRVSVKDLVNDIDTSAFGDDTEEADTEPGNLRPPVTDSISVEHALGSEPTAVIEADDF